MLKELVGVPQQTRMTIMARRYWSQHDPETHNQLFYSFAVMTVS
jgi:hypothetical protein